MNRGNFSRAIPVILIVIIVIIAIAAIVSLARSIFGSNDSGTEQVDQGQSSLVSTDVTRSVRLTERGPIVADENFRSYQITVTPTTRTMTVYEGYLDNVIDTKTYPNNTPAYEEFVHALSRAGMMSGEALMNDADDTRGICATGHVYEYETLQTERTVKRLWTSDCKGAGKGSLDKDVKPRGLNQLFHLQIPDSDDLIDLLDD